MKKLFAATSLFLFAFIIYTDVHAFTCALVDESGNPITAAKAGDIVYLKDSYVNIKSGKMSWKLKANIPTINSKSYKTLINNSGYYFHEGSAETKNNLIPFAIPAFDYIKGTADVIYTLSKAGKCSLSLYISEYTPPQKTYEITAMAGSNGSITPSGMVIVNEGENQSFTIAASPNYNVADVLVDGSSVGAVTNYTFNNVTADHTICATFAINAESCDTAATGVMVDVTISPIYLGLFTYSVDAFRDICDEGPPEVWEFFGTHYSAITFNARLINPSTELHPSSLNIEKYTIKYYPTTDSIGAPPIETDTRFFALEITPPTGTNVTTVSTTGVFLDLNRKIQYANDIASGSYSSASFGLNNYKAVYRFEGKNVFGDRFCFEGEAHFEIANFDNCGL